VAWAWPRQTTIVADFVEFSESENTQSSRTLKSLLKFCLEFGKSLSKFVQTEEKKSIWQFECQIKHKEHENKNIKILYMCFKYWFLETKFHIQLGKQLLWLDLIQWIGCAITQKKFEMHTRRKNEYIHQVFKSMKT